MSNFEPDISTVRGLILNDAGNILVAQRSVEYCARNGGLWELPGGKREEGETDRPAALAREVYEETAVDAVYDIDPFHTEECTFEDNGQKRITDFLVGLALSDVAIADGKEVSKVVWLPPEYALKFPLTDSSRTAIEVYSELVARRIA